MRGLLKFSHAVDILSESLGRITYYLIPLLILVGFYNVVVRYFGRFLGQNLSSNRWIETQWYLFSVIFFLMFAYNLKHDVNVRIDLLYTHWSPKRKAWVNLLGTVLILIPFCVIGLWVTVSPVLVAWGRLPDGSFGTWEISPDPDGLPRAPIKSFILIAFLTLLLQAIAQAFKYLAVITGRQEVVVELAAETQVALAE